MCTADSAIATVNADGTVVCQRTGVTGWEAIFKKVTVDPGTLPTVSVPCSSTTKIVTGGGFVVSNLNLKIARSYPPDMHTWAVEFFNPASGSASTDVFAYAVCVNGS
jgi:hypothetical protein